MPGPDIERILNCLPSPEPEKDWKFDHAVAAGMVDAEQPIPASKDLREEWWNVADQGATGSCVGWATADSMLRWHLVKSNRIQQAETLSVRFIWMASKELDESSGVPTTFIERSGTFLKAALDVARKFGSVPEWVLPFSSARMYPFDEETFYLMAGQLRIRNYVRLAGPDEWRRWLALNGPILTRLDVDETWFRATQTRGMLDVYHHPNWPAGHAVALVGYTPERFIVRNSWGEGWGDKGFAYATQDYALAAFTEAYGVIA